MCGEEVIGETLAVLGSIISVIGTLYNNIRHDHHRAMELWFFSNLFLMLWAGGYVLGYWDGGVSMAALFVMYCIYFVTNVYGLMK